MVSFNGFCTGINNLSNDVLLGLYNKTGLDATHLTTNDTDSTTAKVAKVFATFTLLVPALLLAFQAVDELCFQAGRVVEKFHEGVAFLRRSPGYIAAYNASQE